MSLIRSVNDLSVLRYFYQVDRAIPNRRFVIPEKGNVSETAKYIGANDLFHLCDINFISLEFFFSFSEQNHFNFLSRNYKKLDF